jgi:CDP-glycerol glycerophosphotransferase (TagB/SpsB family)
MRTAWRRPFRVALNAVDRSIGRVTGRRRMLVYVRTAMHAGVVDPITRALECDPRIEVWHISEHPSQTHDIDASLGRPLRWLPDGRAAWTRIDLLLSADPWAAPTLRRCIARLNVFHGVAGKYNLDDPSDLPIGFEEYDRVAFVNADRMRRYLAKGIVRPEVAVLVGFPKADALVNGEYDSRQLREQLGLDEGRSTAIYAPTWSPASSLHLAGEAIVRRLVDAGWNVIVRPHARSLDPDPQYSGGIDWRRRLRAMQIPGRVVVSLEADASPLLAASDLMVTDHSTIGFEFCLLDRPLIVFDAPELARVARINPERIALLRQAARVVHQAAELGSAADEERRNPDRLSQERRAAARALFYEPGTATERALAVAYDLLRLTPLPVTDAAGARHRSAAPAPSVTRPLSRGLEEIR